MMLRGYRYIESLAFTLLTGVTRFQLKEYLSNNCSVGTEH